MRCTQPRDYAALDLPRDHLWAGGRTRRRSGGSVGSVDFNLTVRPIGYGGIAPTIAPTHVVRNTTSDRMALQVSMNASTENWPLVSVIPIANERRIENLLNGARSAPQSGAGLVQTSGFAT